MQSDKLSINLTNKQNRTSAEIAQVQQQGIIEHDLERSRLVKLVHEKYEAKRKAKENLWNSEKGKGYKKKKQAR